MEDLKTKFDKFFEDAKRVYSELDADSHTFRSRSAITLDNMEQQKETCHRTIFEPVIKSLIENLKMRLDCYIEIDAKFSFLVKLNELSSDDISESCKKIASFYSNDISEEDLNTECGIAQHFFFVDPSSSMSHASMYSKIIKDELQSIFPNIEIALRIFLSLFVTNVPDERSFSKLKYIKNSLRNRLSDEKLNAFSLMSIENFEFH